MKKGNVKRIFFRLSDFPPGRDPSFSSSSCPSTRNSQHPSRQCHITDRPAPLTPPADCETSLQPDGTTSSSGYTHSSRRSDGTNQMIESEEEEERREKSETDMKEEQMAIRRIDKHIKSDCRHMHAGTQKPTHT